MARTTNWTRREDARLVDMHGQGLVPTAISRKLDGKGRTAIVTRLVEMGLTPNKAKHDWSEEEIRILREGYEEKHAISRIRSRLGGSRTERAIYAKAHKLGLETRDTAEKAPRRKGKRGRPSHGIGSRDRRMLAMCLAADIPPKEAGVLVQGMPMHRLYDIYRKAGWHSSDRRLTETGRRRKDVERRARNMLGCAVDRTDPVHRMVLTAFAADICGRRAEDTARTALLPMKWIERILGRLDVEGIWPVTVASLEEAGLGPEDFERMAVICSEENRLHDQEMARSLAAFTEK